MTKEKKDFIYKFVKRYYTRNQFEVLYNQLQSGFNCPETSSTSRILDAVSVLLGFCQNERNFKHEPALLLEQNSTRPYADLKPKILKMVDKQTKKVTSELSTTLLLSYLLSSLSSKDRHRLAATAQHYIAQGLYEIIQKCHPELVSGSIKKIPGRARNDIFLAGGIANNKIISEYLISQGAIVNQKIPRGDAGISFGQIIYYLANPRH
jgi:hydrogenase maturation factor HypF (carbamoyltransferase family)